MGVHDIWWAFMNIPWAFIDFHELVYCSLVWQCHGDVMGVRVIAMRIYDADCTMTCHEYFHVIVMNMPHSAAMYII